LAEFVSHALDYPKTGTPVGFTSLPPPPQSERPDFLSGEGSQKRLNDHFYRSEKVLGILFRRVSIDDDMFSHHGDLALTDGTNIWSCLQKTNMDDLGLEALSKPPPEDLMNEMGHLLEAYSDRLLTIAQTHTLSKLVDSESNLLEEELVSGTIMTSWADHNRRNDAVTAMNLQVSVRQQNRHNANIDKFLCRPNSSRRQYATSSQGGLILSLRTKTDGTLMTLMTRNRTDK
jgi:hypothetical protein